MADLFGLALQDANNPFQSPIVIETAKHCARLYSFRYERKWQLGFILIRSAESFRMALQAFEPNGLKRGGVFSGKFSNIHGAILHMR